jgi:hypothetical protein
VGYDRSYMPQPVLDSWIIGYSCKYRASKHLFPISLLADLRHYYTSTLPTLASSPDHPIDRHTDHLPYQQTQSSSTLPTVPSSSSGFLNQSLLAGDTAVVPSASAYRCRGHSATMSLEGKRLHSEQKRRSWRQNPASRRE